MVGVITLDQNFLKNEPFRFLHLTVVTDTQAKCKRSMLAFPVTLGKARFLIGPGKKDHLCPNTIFLCQRNSRTAKLEIMSIHYKCTKPDRYAHSSHCKRWDVMLVLMQHIVCLAGPQMIKVPIAGGLVCVCVCLCVRAWCADVLPGCVFMHCDSVPRDGVGGLQDLLGRAARACRVPGLGGPLHGRLGQRGWHRQVLQPIRRARCPYQECRFSPE